MCTAFPGHSVSQWLAALSGTQGLACWPGTVDKNRNKCVLAEVFAQNWHFALRVQMHVVILYAINTLAVTFQIPSRGWSPPNGSSPSEDFPFISNRKILLFFS